MRNKPIIVLIFSVVLVFGVMVVSLFFFKNNEKKQTTSGSVPEDFFASQSPVEYKIFDKKTLNNESENDSSVVKVVEAGPLALGYMPPVAQPVVPVLSEEGIFNQQTVEDRAETVEPVVSETSAPEQESSFGADVSTTSEMDININNIGSDKELFADFFYANEFGVRYIDVLNQGQDILISQGLMMPEDRIEIDDLDSLISALDTGADYLFQLGEMTQEEYQKSKDNIHIYYEPLITREMIEFKRTNGVSQVPREWINSADKVRLFLATSKQKGGVHSGDIEGLEEEKIVRKQDRGSLFSRISSFLSGFGDFRSPADVYCGVQEGSFLEGARQWVSGFLGNLAQAAGGAGGGCNTCVEACGFCFRQGAPLPVGANVAIAPCCCCCTGGKSPMPLGCLNLYCPPPNAAIWDSVTCPLGTGICGCG